MRIAGSSAVVSGGASGLGLATATALREAGAEVVLLDLPGSDGAQRAQQIGAQFCPGDVTDEDAVQAAIDAASALAPLRVAVSCAGVGSGTRIVGRQGVHSLQEFNRVLAINLTGTFNVLRLAAARMAEADPVDGDRGVIINTASAAAYDGQVGGAAYSASKGGIVAMTLPCARDLASQQIRVVTIAPGLMATPLYLTLPEAARQSVEAQIPHPARVGEPAEFASLALHIVENGYLNGEVIRLDGSLRMAAR